MSRNQNTIMEIFKKSKTLLYRFLEYGRLALIGIVSWMCQECIGMVFFALKRALARFSVLIFFVKSCKVVLDLGRSFSVLMH